MIHFNKGNSIKPMKNSNSPKTFSQHFGSNYIFQISSALRMQFDFDERHYSEKDLHEKADLAVYASQGSVKKKNKKDNFGILADLH